MWVLSYCRSRTDADAPYERKRAQFSLRLAKRKVQPQSPYSAPKTLVGLVFFGGTLALPHRAKSLAMKLALRVAPSDMRAVRPRTAEIEGCDHEDLAARWYS